MTRLRWIGGIFAVVILLILALPWIVSAEQFRPLIESQLSAATGRPVEFGQLSLRLFPLSLRAHGLRITGLATAELVSVRVRALPLLSGNVEVESIALTNPVVEYRAGSSPSSGPSGALPDISAFDIVDGRLVLIDSAGARSEYTHIDASIRRNGPSLIGEVSWKNDSLPVRLQFSASNAAGTWTFSTLDASIGAITAAFTGSIDTNASTVNGNLIVKPTSLAGLPIQSAYKPKGSITANIKVTGPLKKPVLTGAVQIVDLEVSGGKLTQPLRASALGLALTPTRIIASPFTLHVGPTTVLASFQLTDYKLIDATVSTRDASLQDLLVIAQAGEVSGAGTASVQLRATGPLSNPQLSGSGSLAGADLRLPGLQPNLKIDSAQIKFEADSASIENARFHLSKSNGQGAVRVKNFLRPQLALSLQFDQLSNTDLQSWFPPAKGESKPLTVTGDIAVGRMTVNDLLLENFKSGLSLSDKLLTLDPLSAGVYGGRLTGSATVNLKTEPAQIGLKTHLEKIESEQLLAATTPLRKVVTGPLTAEADLHFSPKPGEDFARTLNGAIRFQLAQGKLLPLNLLGEMNALGKFLKPLNTNAANTPFLGMKGQFKIANGAAETDDLRLELDRGAALITGSLHLADQTLNLRMLTTLNKQFSDEVGGTKIGGFLSAAMASPKGELLMPSIVKGTFSKPVFAPDAATLGKMKLSQPQNLQQGVQGVLDLFKGKKKQP